MLELRTLHIDTGAEMRGGQHQVLLLLNALRDAGHECVLLARRGAALARTATEAGFTVYPATNQNVWKHSKQAAIVHAHDAHAHTMAAFGSRQKFVVSRRVAFPVRRSPVSGWKYAKPSRYLAVSEFVSKELQKAGIAEDKIDLVYDGVAAGPTAAPWDPEFPAVALASHDPQKGRDLVELAAKASGIEVVFSDDLAHDLARACLFIYISRAEGLGSSALLAMSMGVPVIASRIGGLAEVFVDGVSGLYVNNDVTEIVRAMRRVMANRPLAHSLIEAGKVRVQQCFTAEHMLRSTLNAYGRAFSG